MDISVFERRFFLGGGRFVAALGGEQFALTEAVEMLRRVRRERRADEWVVLSAADPLNLAGVLTPGGRVPAVHSHRLLYRDGVPVASLTAGGLEWLESLDTAGKHRAESLLSAPRSNSRRRPHRDPQVSPLHPVR